VNENYDEGAIIFNKKLIRYQTAEIVAAKKFIN
jgi:hypothetical protein